MTGEGSARDVPVRIVSCGGGASWESALASLLGRRAVGVELVRRCLDLGELLGVALRERPEVAVLSADLGWLDRELVGTLHEAGVATVAVEAGHSDRLLGAVGVAHRVDGTGGTEELLTLLASWPARRRRPPVRPPTGGRVVAVWGSPGAPGRTTVAVHLAAEIARGGGGVILVDGDGWSPSVAQALGLAPSPSVSRAARLATEGWPLPLDSCLQEARPGLRVLAGLARPDLWLEVRERAWRGVLDRCKETARSTVVDLAAPIEEDEELSFDEIPYRRNVMARTTLAEADRVLMVVRADPVGVRRAVLALRALEEAVPRAVPRASLVLNSVPASMVRRAQLRRELEESTGLPLVAVLPGEAALAGALWGATLLGEVVPRSPWLSALRPLVAAVTAVAA